MGGNVKCTVLMKGKATIIKVSQEGSRNDGTDPGEGAGIWKGGSLWELQPPPSRRAPLEGRDGAD